MRPRHDEKESFTGEERPLLDTVRKKPGNFVRLDPICSVVERKLGDRYMFSLQHDKVFVTQLGIAQFELPPSAFNRAVNREPQAALQLVPLQPSADGR